MPHVDLGGSALSDAPFHPGPVQLFMRDFQSQVTPNETQRNTLIVAGVYILVIGILWCVSGVLEPGKRTEDREWLSEGIYHI
jgi:hypothetical protein